jgi:hypothetical protein
MFMSHYCHLSILQTSLTESGLVERSEFVLVEEAVPDLGAVKNRLAAQQS